jgi:hypothetical protein
MFEIIMLIAFLMAGTSQLLPDKQVGDKMTFKKTGHGKKNQPEQLQQRTKRSEKKRGKAKRRNRDYAYAA